MFKVGDKVKLTEGGISVFNKHSKVKVRIGDSFVIIEDGDDGTFLVLNCSSGEEWWLTEDRMEKLKEHKVGRTMVSFCKILAPLQFAIVLLACLAIGITPELNVPAWALIGCVFFSCILMCFLSLAAAGVEILDNLLGESDGR